MWEIIYTARALKSLRKIPKQWQRRIVKAIDGLTKDPFIGKKLNGEFEGCYSLRVWPYRIIYMLEKRKITVIILDIGHRQSIYMR